MDHKTRSDSAKSGWERLRREIARVIVIFLLLEIIARIPLVKSFLANKLDPYENLLWYSENMPVYKHQLLNGPHYDVWMGGSSYMMTGLQPLWVQSEANAQGIAELTFQNYGLNAMQNLNDMADIYDKWMFQMDQPQYMVLGISISNFTQSAKLGSRARSSPMERTYIFPTSIDDYIGGWLFNNSVLYRYALLLRNATFIPQGAALLQPMPLGGFVEGIDSFTGCDSKAWVPTTTPPGLTVFNDFSSLDHFINVIRARNIPIAVVNIPRQYCGLRLSFSNYDDYASSYLMNVSKHLKDLDVPFLDLDTQFYAQIKENEQYQYFRDISHPNTEGARLFSQWTGDFVAKWLKQMNLVQLIPITNNN